jgi:hypothetical protein
MPPFMGNSLPQYLLDLVANLDPRVFQSIGKKYDLLERDLVKVANRTHSENEMQTGQIKERSKKECWELEKSNQPAKLSWRRTGRQKKESSQSASQS